MGNNWAPIYTTTQKSAVINAVIEHGLTAPQAQRAAAAGELPGEGQSLEGFAMPVTTLRSLVTTEKQKRRTDQQAALEPDVAMRRTSNRLMSLLDRELDRAEKQARHGRLDAAKLRELTKAAREIEALTRQLAPRGNATPASGAEKPSKRQSSDLIDQLASEGRQKRAAPQHAPTQASDARSEHAQRTDTSASGEDEAAATERQYLASKHGAALAGAVSQAADMARQDP